MRPTKTSQNPLRTPLNQLLSRESHVRILRELIISGKCLNVGDLAAATKLDVSGVRRVARALISANILDFDDRNQDQVCFRNDHPLSGPLQALFQAENIETERVEADIRAAVLRISPSPIAAWLTHDESDDKADKLTVGILAEHKYLESSVTSLREMIAAIRNNYSTFIEVHGLTVPDLSALTPEARSKLSNARPLLGIQPHSFLSARSGPRRAVRPDNRNTLHSLRDREALELGKLIAQKITRDPLTLSRAIEFISRRMENASASEAKELREWKELIQTMSAHQLARFLTDSGERAIRLRQSLPFAGLVSQEERAAIRSRLRSS